jgi:hypothetical protein
MLGFVRDPKQDDKQAKFTAALSSVLSVKPDTIRDALQDAKDEEPSPHSRYSYSPEEADT